MDLTKEAKSHTLIQASKLSLSLKAILNLGVHTEDAQFAKKLGETIIACNVFVDNTKHQHRTICDIAEGRRA